MGHLAILLKYQNQRPFTQCHPKYFSIYFFEKFFSWVIIFHITHFYLHSTANEIINSNYGDNNDGKEDIPKHQVVSAFLLG